MLPIILASAAVAAVVSSMFQLIGQWRERVARRREQLLKFAIEMAVQRTELLIRAADKTDTAVKLPDNIFLATRYYRWLRQLERTGQLPPDAVEKANREGAPL